MRKVLARHPDNPVTPVLWEFPNNEGVYLSHDGSTTFIRICSSKEYQTNKHILVDQGWVLQK
jgi:hypothetical protein